MRQSLLDSLVGLSAKDAEYAAQMAGHTVIEIMEGAKGATCTYPNSVILWLDRREIVKAAAAGDPCELGAGT